LIQALSETLRKPKLESNLFKSLFSALLLSCGFAQFAFAHGLIETIPTGTERAAAKIYLPSNYATQRDWPVILLLHGYEENQAFISKYFFGSDDVILNGTQFILVVPEGMKEASPKHYHYWNASDACCDFGHSGVDDVKYLTDLVDQVSEKYSVNKKRVYATGHSNGAFMAHRLACASSDHFAAIAAFAGMTALKMEDCQPNSPVSLLQINALDDETIKYGGDKGFPPLAAYPGADESAQRWARLDLCVPAPVAGADLELTLNLRFGAADATSQSWTNCAGGAEVRQYKIQPYSGLLYHAHTPLLSWNFTTEIVNFLLSKQKP
jgi:polyhydroxybutyrate depolymerase